MRTCTHAAPRLRVLEAGVATVQDLGRPGHAHEGISANGAADRWSARVANTLVGRPPGAPLLEVTGSSLRLEADADLLVALTGAHTSPRVDGHPAPTWEPFVLPAGTSLEVPPPTHGWRTYLAVAGALTAPSVLGSVAPDPMLGIGTSLSRGDALELTTCVCGWDPAYPFFRLGARRPAWTQPTVLDVTAGPELEEYDAAALRGPWTVSPQSDHVGLRAEGPVPRRDGSAEILSRGVPVGAVEVPPSGGLLLLLHGRLITAGYPVPYVATTGSIDRLGQARPGDQLVLREVLLEDAVAAARTQRQELAALAVRAANALRASGLGRLVSEGHLSVRA